MKEVVKAKKHLGQHFLNDSRIAFDITSLLSKNTENVIEIGPGMGVLTQFLIKNNYASITPISFKMSDNRIFQKLKNTIK